MDEVGRTLESLRFLFERSQQALPVAANHPPSHSHHSTKRRNQGLVPEAMKAIKNAKKSKKATKGSEEAASSSAKRWSGQFSNVSTNSDGGTPLTLDGLLEHERAMENSKCTTAYGLARLRRVDPQEWTVADVGVWLDWLRMSEYRAEFIKNAVSGAELKDLDHADFTSLGITKVKTKPSAHLRWQP